MPESRECDAHCRWQQLWVGPLCQHWLHSMFSPELVQPLPGGMRRGPRDPPKPTGGCFPDKRFVCRHQFFPFLPAVPARNMGQWHQLCSVCPGTIFHQHRIIGLPVVSSWAVCSCPWPFLMRQVFDHPNHPCASPALCGMPPKLAAFKQFDLLRLRCGVLPCHGPKVLCSLPRRSDL